MIKQRSPRIHKDLVGLCKIIAASIKCDASLLPKRMVKTFEDSRTKAMSYAHRMVDSGNRSMLIYDSFVGERMGRSPIYLFYDKRSPEFKLLLTEHQIVSVSNGGLNGWAYPLSDKEWVVLS